MKPSKAIKLKALFLLVTFSLNSVVGFACSLGIDMGFNSCKDDHECNEQSEHSDKHKEQHKEHHSHRLHKHADDEKSCNNSSFNPIDDDNCCSDYVVGFQGLDKELAEKSFTKVQDTKYTTFDTCVSINFSKTPYTTPVRIPQKIPDHSPPDVRILIQSFQI